MSRLENETDEEYKIRRQARKVEREKGLEL